MNADGLESRCRPCYNAAKRAYLRSPNGKQKLAKRVARLRADPAYKRKRSEYKTSERGREAERRLRCTDHYREYATRYYRTFVRGTNKSKARWTVGNAIRYGKIPPAKMLLCACGSRAAHYHHHKGYEKEHWLDVAPLCAICHKRAHGTEPS